VGTRIIFLTGALDVTLTGRLRAMLDEALDSGDDVVVNLSGLVAVDSTGIRELLRAQARAAQMGNSFGAVAPTAEVRRLLEAADAAGLLVERRSPPDSSASCAISTG
jgi:anti-anti-sigma factor